MDYRIFNVRMWSFLCVHITHGGWSHRQQLSTFFSQKNSQMFLVLRVGFELWVFWSWVWCSTNWATQPPHTPLKYILQTVSCLYLRDILTTIVVVHFTAIDAVRIVCTSDTVSWCQPQLPTLIKVPLSTDSGICVLDRDTIVLTMGESSELVLTW